MKQEKWDKYTKIGTGPTSIRKVRRSEHLDWLKDCENIVDVGCGAGENMLYLKGDGKERYIEGVTMNEAEKKICGDKGLITTIADMHEIECDDSIYDGILLWDVFEHSPSPWILMDEMNRILQRGGKCLVFIPDQNWVDCEYHLSVFNQRQARWLFEHTGFRIEEMIDCGGESAIYKLIKV